MRQHIIREQMQLMRHLNQSYTDLQYMPVWKRKAYITEMMKESARKEGVEDQSGHNDDAMRQWIEKMHNKTGTNNDESS